MTILWVRKLGGTQPGGSDHEESSGVIHWLHSADTELAGNHDLSPVSGALGVLHVASALAAWGFRIARGLGLSGISHPCWLPKREDAGATSPLKIRAWKSQVTLAKFCRSKPVTGQPRSRGKERDSISPPGRNAYEHRVGRVLRGPVWETGIHKQWTKNCG